MKFHTKKIKLFFLKIKWFFNPFRYFARRRKVNEISAELHIHKVFIDSNANKIIDHARHIASIKSNISTFKKRLTDKLGKFDEIDKFTHDILVDITRVERKADQFLALSKEMDKKVKNLHNKMDRIIKIEDEIDLLDKKKRENQDIFDRHTMLFHSHETELQKISEQFKEAMAIQGRSAVYELQGKKNEFIREFELFLARRYPNEHGRERETNQANPQR